MRLKEQQNTEETLPAIDTSNFNVTETGQVLKYPEKTETEQKLIDIIHNLTRKPEATEQPDKSAYKHLVRENEKLREMIRSQSEQISIMERQAKERPSAMSVITENNRFRERIVDLELEIHSLRKELDSKEKQITNMQCCQNCANYNFDSATACDFIHDCKEYDHWKPRPINC